MRGVGAPHRRLATARADLEASGELAWTMLVFSLFQAIMVRGKKDCAVQCYSEHADVPPAHWIPGSLDPRLIGSPAHWSLRGSNSVCHRPMGRKWSN